MIKYVFQKSYDNFYLFTEFDVIFNDEFTEKLNVFYTKINGENLSIKIDVPSQYQHSVPNTMDISNPYNLKKFYEMKTHDKDNLSYYMLNFFISDNSNLWEIYVSLENELSIIACSEKVCSLFEVVFKPYENENIDQKYKIITDMFGNDIDKKLFIESLEEIYHFKKIR